MTHPVPTMVNTFDEERLARWWLDRPADARRLADRLNLWRVQIEEMHSRSRTFMHDNHVEEIKILIALLDLVANGQLILEDKWRSNNPSKPRRKKPSSSEHNTGTRRQELASERPKKIDKETKAP